MAGVAPGAPIMEWQGALNARGRAPCPRKGHSLTRLVNKPVIVVYGGQGENGRLLSDMFTLNLDLGEWNPVMYAGGPAPAPRMLHTVTAVSASTLVLVGGDATCEESGDIKCRNDVWIFDMHDRYWRELAPDASAPSPRSGHSAVFGSKFGLVPGIYVFGGTNIDNDAGGDVYRLRTSDWRWERLNVVKDPAGASGASAAGDKAPSVEGPGQRESHAAVWFPDRGSMLVVGGDASVELLSDVWLFAPSSRRAGWWIWRRIHLRMARSISENHIKPCAGHSLIVMPTEKTQVLVWGGLEHCEGASGDSTADPGTVAMLDLDSMQCHRLDTCGKHPQGRLLHGLAVVHDRVVVFGGCSAEGKLIESLETAYLLPVKDGSGHQATDFGPVAADAAAGISRAERAIAGSVADTGSSAAVYEELASKSEPLMGPSSIPRGTPLTGRIVEVTEFGYFVSVVIDGKLYKGVLVANPLTEAEVAEAEAAGLVEAPKRKRPVSTSPPPTIHRRPSLDPQAAALPDSPVRMGKVGNRGGSSAIDEIIDLG